MTVALQAARFPQGGESLPEKETKAEQELSREMEM